MMDEWNTRAALLVERCDRWNQIKPSVEIEADIPIKPLSKLDGKSRAEDEK
jgi:hypothetical protein